MSAAVKTQQGVPDDGTATRTQPDFLTVSGVSVSFPHADKKRDERVVVLEGVDLTVNRGEIVTIIGPSGCGKSTLLNCIAGLEKYQMGTIETGGRRIEEPGPDRAVVFQQASLFPWRNVERNVAFGPQMRRWDAQTLRERVQHAIDIVGLKGYEKHFPHQLSGGMQQRVNLARAMVMGTDLILMDEPFGALDAMTKRNMQDELLDLQELVHSTILFITHDLDEAVYLGDRVAIMSTKPGAIKNIYDVPFSRPRSRDIIDSAEFRALTSRLSKLLLVAH